MWPPTVTAQWPSCGLRDSAMSISAMILKREMIEVWIDFGAGGIASWSTPSTRNRTRRSFSCGSMWMSEARSATAFWMM